MSCENESISYVKQNFNRSQCPVFYSLKVSVWMSSQNAFLTWPLVSFLRALSYPFPLYQPQPLQFSIEMDSSWKSYTSGHCAQWYSQPFQGGWWLLSHVGTVSDRYQDLNDLSVPSCFHKTFSFSRSLSSPLHHSKPQNSQMKEWDRKRGKTSNKGAPIIGPAPIFHTQLR